MKICVINTGGTISCVGTPLAPMSATDFGDASQRLLSPIVTEMFPDIELVYEDTLAFPESSTHTLDSTNLQPSDWCLMANFILDSYASYDGFVVLHGTDSMDFTGSALPFLLNCVDANGIGTAVLSKPVIVTGSQVPMFYQKPPPDPQTNPPTPPAPLMINFNTDAFQNFCGAVACARLGIPEVGVYFDSKLFRGNRVLKINASEFRAFDSPNYPAMAQYGIELDLEPELMLPGPVHSSVSLDDPEALAQAKAQLEAVALAIDSHPVMQFNAFPAAYSTSASTAVIANLITACVSQGIKGLVLESYGEGNFPSGNPDNPKAGAIYEALNAASNNDVVLVDCTQVIAGTVNDSAYASGAWLPDAGVLNSSDMTPMAGLAKLTILLAAASFNGWTSDQVRTLMQLNLQGEMQNVSRLDSRTNHSLLAGQSITSLDGSTSLTNDARLGLQLADKKGVLWQPFTALPRDLPGRLEMQNDGNLVFYSPSNTPLWASGTSDPGGASSQLAIVGSEGEVRLELIDYSNGTTHTIFTSPTN